MTNEALPTLSSTGWTVAVVRNASSGMTRELYDCAIPAFREAEKAVLAVSTSDSVLLVSAVEPITSLTVKSLGLTYGEVRKRCPWLFEQGNVQLSHGLSQGT